MYNYYWCCNIERDIVQIQNLSRYNYLIRDSSGLNFFSFFCCCFFFCFFERFYGTSLISNQVSTLLASFFFRRRSSRFFKNAVSLLWRETAPRGFDGLPHSPFQIIIADTLSITTRNVQCLRKALFLEIFYILTLSTFYLNTFTV